MIPLYISIALIVLVASLMAGAALALRKGRNAVAWSTACFVFPPFLLILMMLPKRGARALRKHANAEARGEGLSGWLLS